MLDLATAAAGVALIVVEATDSLITWPSDRIWISPSTLEHASAFLLVPWVWLVLGSAIAYGGRHAPLGPPVGRRRTAVLAALAAFCLTVIIGGLITGWAKGSVRVLPGPNYQVSTPSVKDSEWTTVTAAQYRMWEARILRQDSMVALFGLFMVAGSVIVARTRSQSADVTGEDAVPGGPL